MIRSYAVEIREWVWLSSLAKDTGQGWHHSVLSERSALNRKLQCNYTQNFYFFSFGQTEEILEPLSGFTVSRIPLERFLLTLCSRENLFLDRKSGKNFNRETDNNNKPILFLEFPFVAVREISPHFLSWGYPFPLDRTWRNPMAVKPDRSSNPSLLNPKPKKNWL